MIEVLNKMLRWIVIFVLFNIILTENVENISRFTKLECTYSGKSMSSSFCTIEPNGALTSNFTLTRDLNKAYLITRNYLKTNGKYKEVMKAGAKPFDVCELLVSSDNNPYLRFAKQYLEAKLPNLIHNCPYKIGTYTFSLSLDDDKFIRIFPSGEYKKSIMLYDDVDEKISKTVMYYTLNPRS